jgi:hypothetical protein
MKLLTPKKEITVNPEQRLYVIPTAGGYTCHGFDVVEKLIAGLIKEGRPAPRNAAPVGTPERYAQYRETVNYAELEFRATGKRSAVQLTPELVGKEGRRVEVVHQWKSGETETARFQVGKSSGWMPCHLQLARRGVSSGPAVCLGKILSVRVIA